MAQSNSILFADDSKTLLLYLGMMAKRLGYQTYLARNGEETIRLVKEKKPTVVILGDVGCGEGILDCLRIIRGDEETRDIPVIILIAEGGRVEKAELEKLGYSGLLKKPLNIMEFHDAVRTCLKYGNQRKNIRVPLNLRVFVECRNERRVLFASNLSTEGIFLRTVAPFEKGTEMTLVFNIDSDDPIELQGRVVYTNKLASEIEPEPGMGITFLNIPEDVRCRIDYSITKQVTQDIVPEDSSRMDLDRDDLIL